MRKVIVAIGLALVLSGCATQFGERITDTISAVSNFKVTQGQLDTARVSYNGAVLVPLRRYALLPRCKTGETITVSSPCHDRALLKTLSKADNKVAVGFAETQAAINSGDNTGAVLAYNLLTTAIDTARGLIAKTGVQQ